MQKPGDFVSDLITHYRGSFSGVLRDVSIHPKRHSKRSRTVVTEIKAVDVGKQSATTQEGRSVARRFGYDVGWMLPQYLTPFGETSLQALLQLSLYSLVGIRFLYSAFQTCTLANFTSSFHLATWLFRRVVVQLPPSSGLPRPT